MIFSARGGTALQRKGLVLPEKWTKRASEGHQMPSMVMWRLQNILCVFTQSHLVKVHRLQTWKRSKTSPMLSHSLSICRGDFFGSRTSFFAAGSSCNAPTYFKNGIETLKMLTCWKLGAWRRDLVMIWWVRQKSQSSLRCVRDTDKGRNRNR